MHFDGHGQRIEIDGATNLADKRFDNTMSTYRIGTRQTCKWGFYREANFHDLLFTATGPLEWTNVAAQYNDQVSSVRPINCE